jgi:sulfate/thiosulfate transport system permease protein
MSSAATPQTAMRWTPARAVLLGLVVAWLGVVLVLPLGAIVARVLANGPDSLLRVFSNGDAVFGLELSLAVMAVVVVLNGAFGVLGALVLVRDRFWGRRLLSSIVDLPFAVSPVMTGLAFFLIFGRTGVFAPILERLDWKITFAVPGVVIATLFVTLPFTLREVAYVLEELGTGEEQAAATLGAGSLQTFWRVTLPNIRNGLAYGITLTVARALGEFGAVLVLGGAISGRTQTATTFIFAALDERKDADAYAMATLLAVVSVILLLVLEVAKPRRRRAAERENPVS